MVNAGAELGVELPECGVHGRTHVGPRARVERFRGERVAADEFVEQRVGYFEASIITDRRGPARLLCLATRAR